MARVKRLMDSVGYTGPIAAAGDCTKVRPRLSYSNNFGSHILGTTFELHECEVDDENDIDNIINRATMEKVITNQVRTILINIR